MIDRVKFFFSHLVWLSRRTCMLCVMVVGKLSQTFGEHWGAAPCDDGGVADPLETRPSVTCDILPNLSYKRYERNYGDAPEKSCASPPAFQSHSKSLEPARISRLPTTSCEWSIITMDLARTVSEINGDFSRKSQNFPNPMYLTSPLNFVTAIRIQNKN